MEGKSHISRVLMGIALLCLGAVFVQPLWKISLEAAQFPDGLELYIWIDKISGNNKYIIQNINILNHYIGMKPIHPDAIPELKYFPWVAMGMLGLGLIAVLFNRRWSYLSWAILMTSLGALGIYDFYLWLYDYGHDLDPNAPIKIPGMVYMPPLFGEKDLLNFYVRSYPAWGGILMGMAIILAFSAYYFKKGKKTRELNFERDKSWNMQGTIKMLTGVFLVICLIGCSSKPEPIRFGEDHCEYCKMGIVDKRFGAELITEKHRVYKFDAVECLMDFMEEQKVEHDEILVLPYDGLGQLYPVDSLVFAISTAYKSPMGGNIAAFLPQNAPSGEQLKWEELIRLAP